MRPLCARFAFALLFVVLVATGCSQPRNAETLYREYCAACHGANLEGASAPSMLDDLWTHGGSDAELTRLIAEGDLERGMPGWAAAFSAAEIRSLVVYINERRVGYSRNRDTLPPPAPDHVFATEAHRFRVETVVDDVDTPWSLNWLPDGTLLFTEKSGSLRRLTPAGELLPPVMDTPWVDGSGQAGLLEVAPHPDYATNGWIYLTFSDPQVNSAGENVSFTKVVRGRIRDDVWVDEEVIFATDVDRYRRPGGPHYGSRIVFADGYIFFGIGDRGRQDEAQDLTRPNGKIHRLFDDGRVPPDNPFVGRADALPSIWSFGHRNPQGLDRDPRDGALWETEHGPRGGDELNRIQAGRNYGWPVITYGMNYNGTPITGDTARPGLEQPVTHWTPSIAVCGIDFYEGDAFPGWTGNLLVTALAQQHLRRVVIEDGVVTHQEILLQDFGRCRDVATGPDGLVYVALNNPNRIVRLRPVAE